MGRRAAYRKQWQHGGSLWNNDQTLALEAAIRMALVAEFGPDGGSDGPMSAEEPWEPPLDPEDIDGLAVRRDDGTYTLQEVADELGVTRERARQIEALALRKFAAGMFRECPDLFGTIKPSNLAILTPTKAFPRRTCRKAHQEAA